MIGLLTTVASCLAVRATLAAAATAASDTSTRNSTGSFNPALTGHLLKFLNHFDDSIIGFHLMVPHDDVLFKSLTADKPNCHNQLLEYVTQINRLRNMIEKDPEISLKKNRFKTGSPAANGSCNARRDSGSQEFLNASFSDRESSTENSANQTESVRDPIKDVSRIASKPVVSSKSVPLDANNKNFCRGKSLNKTKLLKKLLILQKANQYSEDNRKVSTASRSKEREGATARLDLKPVYLRRRIPRETFTDTVRSHGYDRRDGPRISGAALLIVPPLINKSDRPRSSEQRNDMITDTGVISVFRKKDLRHNFTNFRGSLDTYLPVVRYYNRNNYENKSVRKYSDSWADSRFYCSQIELPDILKQLLGNFISKKGDINCTSYSVKPGEELSVDTLPSNSSGGNIQIFLILNPEKTYRTPLHYYSSAEKDVINFPGDSQGDSSRAIPPSSSVPPSDLSTSEEPSGSTQGYRIDSAATQRSAAAKSHSDILTEHSPVKSQNRDTSGSVRMPEPRLSGGHDPSVRIRPFVEDNSFLIRSLAERGIGRTESEKRTVRNRRTVASHSDNGPRESPNGKFEIEPSSYKVTNGTVEKARDSSDSDYGGTNGNETMQVSDSTGSAQVNSLPRPPDQASDRSDGSVEKVSEKEARSDAADDVGTEAADTCSHPTYLSKAVKKSSHKIDSKVKGETEGLPDFIKLYNNNMKTSLMKRLNRTNSNGTQRFTGRDKLVDIFRPISSSIRDINSIVKKIGNKQVIYFANGSRVPESGQNFSDIRLLKLLQPSSRGAAAESGRNSCVDRDPAFETRDSSSTDRARVDSRTAGYGNASTAERRDDKSPDPPEDLTLSAPSNLLIKLMDLKKLDGSSLQDRTTENIVSYRSMASYNASDAAFAKESDRNTKSPDNYSSPVYSYLDESPSRPSTTSRIDDSFEGPTAPADRAFYRVYNATDTERNRDPSKCGYNSYAGGFFGCTCNGIDLAPATYSPDLTDRDELPPFAPLISVNIFPIVGCRKRPPPLGATSLIKELLRASRNRLDHEKSSDLSDLIDIKGVRSSEKARINETLKKKLEAILSGRGCINDLMKMKIHNILEQSNRNAKNRNFMSLA